MTTRRQKTTLVLLLMVWAIVALWAWSSIRTAPSPIPVTAARPAARPSGLEEGALLRLRLDLLDRDPTVGEPRRDLFSTTPLAAVASGGPAEPSGVEAVAGPPAAGVQLRYMGYVETGGGTIALLRDGPEMYLARKGDRVGPGYLITMVDAGFIELEYQGARRRLTVHVPDNGNDRR